jgi:regulator of nucleoside diphosphate kinase
MQPTIRIFTGADQDRLRQFISAQQARLEHEAEALAQLRRRVEEGEVVGADEIPGEVVTIYSQIRVSDVANERSHVMTVALPSHSEFHGGSTLVRAHPALEVIGARVGDEVTWSSAHGRRRARIDEILFQPEASSRRSRRRARQPTTAHRPVRGHWQEQRI